MKVKGSHCKTCGRWYPDAMFEIECCGACYAAKKQKDKATPDKAATPSKVATPNKVAVAPSSATETPQQKLKRQYPPATKKKSTSAFTIRLDSDLLQSLKDEAERQQRRSVNNLVQAVVSDFAMRVKHREKTGELPPPPG